MPCATIFATAIASSPSGGKADSPSPGRSGTSNRYCSRQHVDVVRPVPPRSRAAVEQHQHRSLAPRPPHHRSVAARRFRSPRGPFEPVQKCCRLQFDPIVHPVSICGYSWKARDAAATSSRSGHSIRNARNHDDRLHRRHPPAMAQRRARPGIARSAAAGRRSCSATSSASARSTIWRRRCSIAASTCTGSSATTTTTADPRCGPTSSNPTATRAPRKARCTPGSSRSPACASPASAARSARASGNRPNRRACIAARNCPRTWPASAWREEHIAALIHSLGATAIWPEDYDYLATQRADILVTHEAPRSHPSGNAALDALARAMGASLIVHGHHHVCLSRRGAGRPARDGRRGRLGRHDRRRLLWPGEAPRHLGNLIAGWSLEAEAVTQ